MATPFEFEITARDPRTQARTGRLHTPHGVIETPAFMPVGTQGSVKALSQEDLRVIGAQIVLANAYHLYLRPGTAVLEQAGGLHPFMHWERPLLTDSGGFQVFSLSGLTKVSRDGVTFQSHLDGSRHTFTPERSVDIQRSIGADIIMCFDECTRYPVTHAEAARSMRMTMQWAERCNRHWRDTDDGRQALFGIVQGGVYSDLRKESAESLTAIGFPGYAIGGVSVGESKTEMRDAVAAATPHLPEDRPRYLMGVGPPDDFLDAVAMGVDMFDCVMPTRNARNGALFTSEGRINIKNQRFATDFGPLDPRCACPVCKVYSRAYLSHLYRAGEIAALRFNTLHNLFFMLDLAASAQKAIGAGRFDAFRQEILNQAAV